MRLLSRVRNFILTVLALHFYCSLTWSHVITTPKQWVTGVSNQLCVFLDSPSTAEDFVDVNLFDELTGQYVPLQTIRLVEGKLSVCDELYFNETSKRDIEILVNGTLNGEAIEYKEFIKVARTSTSVFIQTDKYLYKPSQKVQFRILGVEGPYLKVSREQYEEIWVENPSGSRIAQWLNVSNANGLIHMSFQLSEEPEEGKYKVYATLSEQKTVSTEFKVEEYVLPRFEVTVEPPKYILGTSNIFDFKVCAKYTFGQPVKGNVSLILNEDYFGKRYKLTEKNDTISGCQKITCNKSEVNVNNHSRFIERLVARAIVTESGTGVQLQSEEVGIKISRRAISFKDISPQKYSKPGLPFLAEIQASFPDGSPAANEKMEVCANDDHCKYYTTSDNGILKFAIPSHLQREVVITAINYTEIRSNNSWRRIMYSSFFHLAITNYYSPSKSYLGIAFDEPNLECSGSADDIDVQLPVMFSANDEDVVDMNIQVISRGQIQFSKTFKQSLANGKSSYIKDDLLIEPIQKKEANINITTGSFVVNFKLPKTVSPKAIIIVWYKRKDDELVADTRELSVEKCLLNDVNLSWSSDLLRPGEETTLTLEAEPLSLCSLGVVDKSVDLLSKKNSLSIDILLKAAESYRLGEKHHHLYCEEHFGPSRLINNSRRRRDYIIGDLSPDGYMGSLTPVTVYDMFYRAGITPMFGNMSRCYPIHRIMSDDLPGRVSFDYEPLEFNAVNFMVRRKMEFNPPKKVLKKVTNDELKGGKRAYFPETWLWDLITITDSGYANESLKLPDTVTDWVGSAVCVHPTRGVGISNPATITTFRDFFVDLTLPPSVKRGEILPVKISVFNYLKEPLPIHVLVEKSNAYQLFDESDPNLRSGEREGCVPAEDKVVFTVKIQPKDVGHVNISVLANVNPNQLDTCGGSTVAKERSDYIVKPIRVEIEGFVKEEVQSKYICAQEHANGESSITWNMTPPSGIIPDSDRGYVSVVGDLMGPTIENLGHLVRMPTGCGEQNMIGFAPNIFVMQYLEASGQKQRDVTENAIKYMKRGYQRELNYRHDDGSYSAFGKRDSSGSTWLTAFVLKSFSQAKQFISIDAKDLQVSKKWLKGKQFENGCFESVGKVLHKDMKGGLSSSNSPSLLSSFVLISLLEAGENITSRVVTDALLCLKADDSDATIPYSLAVKTYALSLARDPEAEQYLKKLISLGERTTEILFWNPVPPQASSKSVQVETAGYALLALSSISGGNPSQDYFSEIKGVVTWLNEQRNSRGGFVSTQDTIVSLQSLAEFEKTMKQDKIDLTIIVSGQDLESHFAVNENNKLLQQRAPLRTFPANVTFDVYGEGCALIQSVLRYNIPNPEWSRAFNLSVDVENGVKGGCKNRKITTCASYLLEDKVSNMAIIEVDLVSGYIPDKNSLKKAVKDKIVKRYEVDGSLVTFYIDEFSQEDTCVSVDVIREVEVDNLKPGSVKVYDYYKPEYFVTEKYELPNTECRTNLEEA